MPKKKPKIIRPAPSKTLSNSPTYNPYRFLSNSSLSKFIASLIIVICLFIGSWSLLHGEITFHVDIARDFMLIHQMVENHKPDLIGPRSSIPGFFHGPLWYYLNLPAFILAQGNPVLVGWFWLFLIAVNIFLVYHLTRHIFNSSTGLFAATLYATLTPHFVNQLFNPYGSLFLFPLILYFNHLYLTHRQARYIAALFFTYGLTFQFQTAFAAPILCLNLLILLPLILKRQLYRHLLALFALLPPLSTFILFDLRHDFLQTKSIINFLVTPSQSGPSMTNTFSDRLHNTLYVGLNPAADTTGIGAYLGLLTFIVLILGSLTPHHTAKTFYRVSLCLYLGFWVLMSFYTGEVWQFYYWPFMVLGVITLSTLPHLISLLTKQRTYRRPLVYLSTLFVATIIATNLLHTVSTKLVNATFTGYDPSSWLFNTRLAHQIYQDADQDFGYYVYTPELYAYTPKYAMLYTARFYPNLQIHPSTKMPLTYLIMAPAPDYRPDLTGDWWQVGQVKIDQEPDQVFHFPNGYLVKKFLLSPEAQAIEVDPLMLDTLIFR